MYTLIYIILYYIVKFHILKLHRLILIILKIKIALRYTNL
jgi:hypothetical protein